MSFYNISKPQFCLPIPYSYSTPIRPNNKIGSSDP